MTIRRIGVLATMLVAAMATADARQPKPLPAFTVIAPDGATVESAGLAGEGTSLLVYVQPRCAPCSALLEQLDSDERDDANRIVIVGGGMDAEAVAALAPKYRNLAASRWLADPQRAGVKALAIEANPTVFGLRRGNIEWRLAGTPRLARELESILFTWLEKR